MNKSLNKYFVILLSAAMLFVSGCSKDEDTSGPVIVLIGDAVIVLELQEQYLEPGATAEDDNDGSVPVSISGTVNINLKGTYTITYTATDEAGNTSTATRTVQVINAADFLGGNYVNAVDSCVSGVNSTFDATILTSNTVNGEFTISNFGAFGASTVITCLYNPGTLGISGNTPQSLGGGATLTSINAQSGVSSTSPVIFRITYGWIDSGGLSDICTSTYIK